MPGPKYPSEFRSASPGFQDGQDALKPKPCCDALCLKKKRFYNNLPLYVQMNKTNDYYFCKQFIILTGFTRLTHDQIAKHIRLDNSELLNWEPSS